MWIERIDFAGFGNVSGEKIDFKGDKLNLVVEANEYGKSTIASAVWAILYDFPNDQRAGQISEREARRPKAGSDLPFIASIDITSRGRKLKIIRDFSDGACQVIETSQGNRDVTAEFRGARGEDEVGLRLTGMTRQMFRSTCFVGQNELNEHAFSGDSDLTALFQGLADSAAPAANAGAAIEVIEQTLNQFAYKGKRNKVELILRDLEGQYYELSDKVKNLERDRIAVGSDLKRLGELDLNIHGDNQQARANEYFQLCMQAADIDNRLIQGQSTLAKVYELRQELKNLGVSDSFPLDSVKKVEELWTRRQSRIADYDRYFQEIAPKINEYESHERNIREKWEGLQGFTLEDVQAMGALAVNFQNMYNELTELRKRRVEEFEKVEDLDIDMNEVKNVRQALLSLEPRDYDDARGYIALINSFKDSISESERAIWRNNMLISEIEEQRKTKKSMFAFPGTSARKKEHEAAEQEIEKHTKNIEELKNKIGGLEARLDSLARKAGMQDGGQLVKQFEEYSSKSTDLKDLDVVDQVISTRESALGKTKMDLEPYFAKAGRQAWDINPESALELVDHATKSVEANKNLNTTFGAVKQSRQQLDFLGNEVKAIDNELKVIFQKANVEESDKIDEMHQEFFSKLASFHRSQGMRNELRKMETDMSSGFTPDELPPQIERLESNRLEIFERMQMLAEQFPEIADLAPPVNAPPRRMSLSGDTSSKMYLEDLRKERDELTLRVRTASMNYDQNYQNAAEQLELIQLDLNNIRRAKTALELARDTLQRLSGATYVDWATKLNEIAKQMLDNIGIDFEELHFGNDLSLTARKKGEDQTLDSARIMSQLSTGAKEQLHWLARMVVSRFLSKDNPLPIILDEPFSETDDERFVRVMQFLIDVLVPHHQVIIFSCHHQRHQWLGGQLNQTQKSKIEFVRRTPLRAQAPTNK